MEVKERAYWIIDIWDNDSEWEIPFMNFVQPIDPRQDPIATGKILKRMAM